MDTMNNEWRDRAFDLIANTNLSFFLTGKAGTGKTTFLREVRKEISKNFVTLAPTGIAALNAGGETIHSFFGFPLEAIPIGKPGRVNQERLEIIKHTDTFIIDEVSMVRCDIVDAIDTTLRMVMGNKFPFGGKQIVFVGDMLQLEPIVARDADKEIMTHNYGNCKGYFFQAKVFQKLRLPSIEFLKIYRQDDIRFKQILNEVREGSISNTSLTELNKRVKDHVGLDYVITLTPYKKNAQAINDEQLDMLKSELHCYEGKIEKDFPIKELPSPNELKLKVGAQVMFNRNDPARRWVNGTIGHIKKLDNELITVTLENGKDVEVGQVVWEHTKQTYDRKNKEVKKEVTGSYTQYPLSLAWAITIHKSQGLTFDNMILDLKRGLFSDGQLYVALSRVRTIEGLYLNAPIKNSYIKGNNELLSFTQNINDVEAVTSDLEKGKRIYAIIKNHDIDTMTLQLKELAMEEAHKGNNKDAIKTISILFDHLICDNHLYFESDFYKTISGNSLTSLFLKAFFALYGGHYEKSIEICDEIIFRHSCKEALYLKSRALIKLGRFSDADLTHLKIIELLGKDVDLKIFYSVGCLNEEIGDPGLGILQHLHQKFPSYLPLIESLHKYSSLRGIKIPENDQEFVKSFNSISHTPDFIKLYIDSSEKDKEMFSNQIIKVAF